MASSLLIGANVPVVPVTRDLFGTDGKGAVVAMVQTVVRGGESLGRFFTNGHDIWAHPGLLAEENRLVDTVCWYRITLERGEVVLRQDPDRRSGQADPRTFRALPLTVASKPVDTLVWLIDALRAMHGRCACGDGCQHGNDHPDALGFRDAVLVELERHSGTLLAVCGHCYDALAAEDTHLRDNRTVIDGRRVLPHAALQILALPG